MDKLNTEKLDKRSRDELPDEMFAVPKKRKLPLHDEKHTRMAWDMVDRTQGLTSEERSEARHRIIRRAHELGIDTTEWNKVKSMSISAMALNISNSGHPNKMPFSGILTRLGEPSDAAPQGSGGRKILVTHEAAEAALPTLLGMAVDFTPAFDGHDEQKKIGLITSAHIEGNALMIEGFVYAADFPEIAKLIQRLKDSLGFSFEAQQLYVEDPSADVLKVTELTFTGAAILQKDTAAYTSTSLAASAAKDFLKMTPEELKALLAEAVAPISKRLDDIEAKAKDKVEANSAVRAMVEPHANACEACAAGMEAAGVGGHPDNGHVVVLRRMAGHLRAAAAVGHIPHIFRDHDMMTANADKDAEKLAAEKALKDAVDAAVKPLQDKLAAAETKLADATSKARSETAAPERKTLNNAQVARLMSKAGLAAPEGDDKLELAKVNDALSKAGLTTQQRIMLKSELSRAGVLAD